MYKLSIVATVGCVLSQNISQKKILQIKIPATISFNKDIVFFVRCGKLF